MPLIWYAMNHRARWKTTNDRQKIYVMSIICCTLADRALTGYTTKISELELKSAPLHCECYPVGHRDAYFVIHLLYVIHKEV